MNHNGNLQATKKFTESVFIVKSSGSTVTKRNKLSTTRRNLFDLFTLASGALTSSMTLQHCAKSGTLYWVWVGVPSEFQITYDADHQCQVWSKSITIFVDRTWAWRGSWIQTTVLLCVYFVRCEQVGVDVFNINSHLYSGYFFASVENWFVVSSWNYFFCVLPCRSLCQKMEEPVCMSVAVFNIWISCQKFLVTWFLPEEAIGLQFGYYPSLMTNRCWSSGS